VEWCRNEWIIPDDVMQLMPGVERRFPPDGRRSCSRPHTYVVRPVTSHICIPIILYYQYEIVYNYTTVYNKTNIILLLLLLLLLLLFYLPSVVKIPRAHVNNVYKSRKRTLNYERRGCNDGSNAVGGHTLVQTGVAAFQPRESQVSILLESSGNGRQRTVTLIVTQAQTQTWKFIHSFIHSFIYLFCSQKVKQLQMRHAQQQEQDNKV